MRKMATRWAICGSGKIATDFCLCLNSLPKSEHQIVAVAASTKEKADSFASEFDIPNSYGSYKELADLNDIGVDKTGSIILRYENDCFASLAFSTETMPGHNLMVIRGSMGNIQIPDCFWCPDKVIVPSGELQQCPLPDVKNAEKFNFGNSQGLTYEAQAARDCLIKGIKEHPLMPHGDSETIMYICQQVLNQHGLKYDFP